MCGALPSWRIPRRLNCGHAKAGFDTLRGAVGLVKDVQDTLPADKKEVVSRTLEEADKQLRLPDAQIAQALGYAQRRCTYPPTPMLLVGYRTLTGEAVDIHECPICKRDDAGQWQWTRTTPQAS